MNLSVSNFLPLKTNYNRINPALNKGFSSLKSLTCDTVSFGAAEKSEEELKKQAIRNCRKTLLEGIREKGYKRIKDCPPDVIYNALWLDCKIEKDGSLTLFEYRQPRENVTFKDLGLSEDKLFKKVKKIEENADFRGSELTSLHNLECIEHSADFDSERKIKVSRPLKIALSLYVTGLDSPIIEETGYFGDPDNPKKSKKRMIKLDDGSYYIKISNENKSKYRVDPRLPREERISELKKRLGNVPKILKSDKTNDKEKQDAVRILFDILFLPGRSQYCNRYAMCGKLHEDENEDDRREGKLLTIGYYKQPMDDISFEDLGIDENTLFKYIRYIYGNADFNGSKATSLGNVKRILGDANFDGSNITDIKNLCYISESANFGNAKITKESLCDELRVGETVFEGGACARCPGGCEGRVGALRRQSLPLRHNRRGI